MEPHIQHRYEAVRRNFDRHQEIKSTTIKSLNNTIFLLSTGTFVLSMSLIAYLKSEIFYPRLLVLAWLFLLLAIAGSAWAQWCMASCSIQNQNLLNDWVKSAFTVPGPNWNMDTSKDEKIQKATKLGKFLTKLTIFFVVSGLLSLFFFASINILK